MKNLFLLLLLCHVSSPVKHSLTFFFSTSAGIQNFPEFVASALVDDTQAAYCDNNKKIEIKQAAGKKLFDENPDLLAIYTEECFNNWPELFKYFLNSVMQLLNQQEGVHNVQLIQSCEWDENTEEVKGSLLGAYDGEASVSLDLKTLTWIALKPEAVAVKQMLDAEKAITEGTVTSMTVFYPNWLKTYLNNEKIYPLRPVLPSVSLLQKTPSSPVSCHATGFYPDRATMFWRKDGEELHEDVDHGEILPNHDGTFQMSVDLNISSVRAKDWHRYDCVFQLSGVENNTITKLDKSVIRTNLVPPPKFPVGAIIGIVLGLVLLAVCITAIIIWKKKRNGPDTGASVRIRNLMQDNSSMGSTNSF